NSMVISVGQTPTSLELGLTNGQYDMIGQPSGYVVQPSDIPTLNSSANVLVKFSSPTLSALYFQFNMDQNNTVSPGVGQALQDVQFRRALYTAIGCPAPQAFLDQALNGVVKSTCGF